MLRPQAFVLCEKVLLDKNDVPSLIAVFSKVTAVVNGEVPANAVVPKEWCIFTSWLIELSDVGKQYTQAYRVVYPNGEQFGEPVRIPLQILPGKRHSQTIANSQGLPVGQNGLYTVESWVEEGDKKIGESISLQFEIEVQKLKRRQEVKA